MTLSLSTVAVLFLLVSFVLAVIFNENLKSPLLWAVWAGVIPLVLGALFGH